MKEHYDNLDGFRVIACLGIIGMHIDADIAYVELRKRLYAVVQAAFLRLRRGRVGQV